MGKEGFEIAPWAAEKYAKAQEVFPGWIEEVRKIYGNDKHQHRCTCPHALSRTGEDALYCSTGGSP